MPPRSARLSSASRAARASPRNGGRSRGRTQPHSSSQRIRRPRKTNWVTGQINAWAEVPAGARSGRGNRLPDRFDLRSRVLDSGGRLLPPRSIFRGGRRASTRRRWPITRRTATMWQSLFICGCADYLREKMDLDSVRGCGGFDNMGNEGRRGRPSRARRVIVFDIIEIRLTEPSVPGGQPRLLP